MNAGINMKIRAGRDVRVGDIENFVNSISKNVKEKKKCLRNLNNYYEQTFSSQNEISGRDKELNAISEFFKSKNVVIIWGLGGVGKTELAHAYFKKNKQKYKNILWINGESFDSCKESIKKICSNLNIENEEDISFNISKIYGYFNEDTLLIIDNVNEPEKIKYIVPKPVFAYVKCIVTTQISDWDIRDKYAIFCLKTLSKEESLKLIQNLLLPNNKLIPLSILEKLVVELEGLPLALHHVAACILRSGKNPEEFIREYINNIGIYINKQDKFVNETVFMTVSQTFEKLKEDEEYSKVVYDIFGILCFLNSENISRDMFDTEYFADYNSEDVQNALKLLETYSLINMNKNNLLSIHRLVQEVFRVILVNENKYDLYIRKSMKLLFHYKYKYSIHGSVTFKQIKENFDLEKFRFELNSEENLIFLNSLAYYGCEKEFHKLLICLGKSNSVLSWWKFLTFQSNEIETYLNKEDEHNQTTLTLAVKNGNLSIVETILKYNVNVNVRTDTGKTPLMISVRNGYDNVVSLLLKNNADMKICDKYGYTVMHFAAVSGMLPLINRLKNECCSIEALNNERESILHIASSYGQVDVVDFCIKEGLSCDSVDDKGFSPLHCAAQNGHIHIVEKLLTCKSNINAVTSDGQTPLMISASKGHEDVVNVLLSRGANCNLCDSNGNTAIHYAAVGGKLSILTELKKKGCSIKTLNKYRKSILDIASDYGHDNFVVFCIERGLSFHNFTNISSKSTVHDRAIHLNLHQNTMSACNVSFKISSDLFGA